MTSKCDNIPRLLEVIVKDEYIIRNSKPEDCEAILKYIKDLAVFENEPESVVEITNEVFRQDGFGESPSFRCLVAADKNGYAVYVNSYSTWKGRALWIEDIFVRADCRGRGIGKEFIKCFAKMSLDSGLSKIRCNVLSWNNMAKSVYQKLGGIVEEDWRQCTFTNETLKKLSNS
ncbi:thialysine N-epsilon-acetyltransferase-like isoform X2 [Xenia sp. Carnegie-2017]|uniref:thialysine N-epsilon-acetyltransferase-like isoform X2 n=1 Tax=Xenia sp. Carnegie-2017 TaxID=2897299 RepID=UPI001F049747|nr:thialysine N-epsilon-acetyltransferase-like isoform X2 [Xenia sp. Carnegie-2017]